VQISCPERVQFANAVKTATRFCERRSTRPSWEMLLVEYGDAKTAFFHARNARCELRMLVPCENIPGHPEFKNTFTIGSDIFSRVVGACEESQLSIGCTADAINVQWPGTEYTLQTTSVEFTRVGPFVCKNYVMVHPVEFSSCLRRVLFCCGEDAPRFNLAAITCKVDGDDLIIDASDGRCAIRTKCKCVVLGKIERIVIPSDSVKYIDALTSLGGSDSLQVGFTDYVHLRYGGSVVNISIDEGRTPDLDSFMKLVESTVARTNRESLLLAISQIYCMLDVETMACVLSFSPGSCRAKSGKSSVAFECQVHEEFELSLDCKTLKRFLEGAPLNAEIEIHFTGTTSPIHFLYGVTQFLMMPMSV
jgi:DNA polymerase III sliding clamp (beta) subunit (PCNA family)